MFDTLKKKRYFTKLKHLFSEGLSKEKIVPFDDEFYRKMDDTFVGGLPVSMQMKYLKPILPPGKCYDRSLYMFLCFPDSLLVRADNKDLELEYGKENAGHGWMELGDYVYDPSLMLRFDKDLYYEMYEPTNIKKYTTHDYIDANPHGYYDIKETKLEDFLPHGKKRCELAVIIPVVEHTIKIEQNEEFKEEFAKFLEKIEYDVDEIQEELDSKFSEYVKRKKGLH